VPGDRFRALALRVLLLDLGHFVWVVAHPPEGLEDGLVLAGQPFGGAGAPVVDDVERTCSMPFRPVTSYSRISSSGSMPSFSGG